MDTILKLVLGLPIAALAVILAVKLSDFGTKEPLQRLGLEAEKAYELEQQPAVAYVDGHPQPIHTKE